MPKNTLPSSRRWSRIQPTVKALHVLVDGDPLAIPDRLGEAYPLVLRLGRFLETDIRVQRDPKATDGPLDPDIHGPPTDLVSLAAPWLRGFPTVAALDEAAGRLLVRAELFQPAREFIRIARNKLAISERESAEMKVQDEAADASDFLGQKAGNREVGGVQNLMLAAVGTLGMFLSGAVASDFATRSLLVQRAAAVLAASETEVEGFAATLPADLGQALRALVKEGRRLGDAAPMVIPDSPDPFVPDDVEELARAMILSGQAPPTPWRPFIHRLAFDRTPLRHLPPLSGLTALESLDLSGTQVIDVSPLAHIHIRGLRIERGWTS